MKAASRWSCRMRLLARPRLRAARLSGCTDFDGDALPTPSSLDPLSASTLWPGDGAYVKDEGEFPMNSFLVQVNSKGYATIMNNRHYENLKWKRKNKKGNEHHGMVKPGDRLVLYCTSTVPNETHRSFLAFSVAVSSVSADRTAFELGEPQFFSNPLKRVDIHKYVKQGKLDKCFDYCGEQWFNITKLEPTAVEQIFDLVEPVDPIEPQIPPRQVRNQTALGRGRRAVRAAVRRLRGRRG